MITKNVKMIINQSLAKIISTLLPPQIMKSKANFTIWESKDFMLLQLIFMNQYPTPGHLQQNQLNENPRYPE
jgi:hypothetical protein